MSKDAGKVAWIAAEVPERSGTVYLAEFAARVAGRFKRPLGDLFGIESFGVNLTTLATGAQSALKHRHAIQDGSCPKSSSPPRSPAALLALLGT